MRTDFSAGFVAEKNLAHTTQFLSAAIRFESGPLYVVQRDATGVGGNVTIGINVHYPLVISWGDIGSEVDHEAKKLDVEQATIELSNTPELPGNINLAQYLVDPEATIVDIYANYETSGGTIHQELLNSYVFFDPSAWSYTRITLTLTSLFEYWFSKPVLEVITDEWFEGKNIDEALRDEDAIGSVVPLVFGDMPWVPGKRVQLAGDTDADDEKYLFAECGCGSFDLDDVRFKTDNAQEASPGVDVDFSGDADSSFDVVPAFVVDPNRTWKGYGLISHNPVEGHWVKYGNDSKRSSYQFTAPSNLINPRVTGVLIPYMTAAGTPAPLRMVLIPEDEKFADAFDDQLDFDTVGEFGNRIASYDLDPRSLIFNGIDGFAGGEDYLNGTYASFGINGAVKPGKRYSLVMGIPSAMSGGMGASDYYTQWVGAREIDQGADPTEDDRTSNLGFADRGYTRSGGDGELGSSTNPWAVEIELDHDGYRIGDINAPILMAFTLDEPNVFDGIEMQLFLTGDDPQGSVNVSILSPDARRPGRGLVQKDVSVSFSVFDFFTAIDTGQPDYYVQVGENVVVTGLTLEQAENSAEILGGEIKLLPDRLAALTAAGFGGKALKTFTPIALEAGEHWLLVEGQLSETTNTQVFQGFKIQARGGYFGSGRPGGIYAPATNANGSFYNQAGQFMKTTPIYGDAETQQPLALTIRLRAVGLDIDSNCLLALSEPLNDESTDDDVGPPPQTLTATVQSGTFSFADVFTCLLDRAEVPADRRGAMSFGISGRFDGIVDAQITFKDLFLKLAFESCSVVDWSAGKFVVRPIPAAGAASVATISYDEIVTTGREPQVTVERTDPSQIANLIDVRWNRNLRTGKYDGYTERKDAASITKRGQKILVDHFKCDFIRTEAHAIALAERYLPYYANAWNRARIVTDRINLELEKADVVQIAADV